VLIALALSAAQPAAPTPPPAARAPETAIDVTAGVIAIRDWLTCLDAEGARATATREAGAAQMRGAFSACAGWEESTRTAVTAAFGAERFRDIAARLRREWPAQFAGRARGGLGELAGGAWGACVEGALASGSARRAGRSDEAIVEASFSHCAQQERAFRATLAAGGDEAGADSAVAAMRARLRDGAEAGFRPPAQTPPKQ